jgi:ABC-type antimicrobial peptide transport system permease subunit
MGVGRLIEPMGKIIRINGNPFEIVGTLKPKGLSYDGADGDNVIFIPLNTALQRALNNDYLEFCSEYFRLVKQVLSCRIKP